MQRVKDQSEAEALPLTCLLVEVNRAQSASTFAPRLIIHRARSLRLYEPQHALRAPSPPRGALPMRFNTAFAANTNPTACGAADDTAAIIIVIRSDDGLFRV